MRRILLTAFLFFICMALASSAFAEAGRDTQSAPDLDDHLFRGDLYYYSGDFFRAITEYQTFLFKQHQDPRAERVELKMAWLYHRAGENRDAAQLLNRIASVKPDEPLGWWSRYYMGTAAQVAGRQDLARASFQELIDFCSPLLAELAITDPKAAECYQLLIESRLAMANYHAIRHEFDQAALQLEQLPADWAKAAEAAEIAAMVRGIPIPRKSPAVAGALSIVPGFGHLYLGEYSTALLAMIWNGAFIYGIVDSVLSQNYGQAILIGLIETIWYGGTIFGAISGAHRFNRDAMRIVESGLRQDISEFRSMEPWPVRFPVAYPTQLELKLSF